MKGSVGGHRDDTLFAQVQHPGVLVDPVTVVSLLCTALWNVGGHYKDVLFSHMKHSDSLLEMVMGSQGRYYT